MKRWAVFLDRDGTLNEEVGYVDSLDKLRIIPVAYEAVRLLNAHQMLAVVVTNQSGVARGFFDEAFVHTVHAYMDALFRFHGARIDAFYFCPHHPEGREPYRMQCPCRKPEPGLLKRASEELDIDLTRSWMIGDMAKDVLAGQRAGAKGVIVKTGHPTGTDNMAATADYVARDVLEAVVHIIGKLRNEGPRD